MLAREKLKHKICFVWLARLELSHKCFTVFVPFGDCLIHMLIDMYTVQSIYIFLVN